MNNYWFSVSQHNDNIQHNLTKHGWLNIILFICIHIVFILLINHFSPSAAMTLLIILPLASLSSTMFLMTMYTKMEHPTWHPSNQGGGISGTV